MVRIIIAKGLAAFGSVPCCLYANNFAGAIVPLDPGSDMHPRTEDFLEIVKREFDFEPNVKTFAEGTKTAEDAAAAIGCEVDHIAASIVVDTDDGLAVVVTSGANRVDMNRVATLLDCTDATMADPAKIRETLGWSIGGVPPFCHDTDVPVLVDDTLFSYETVWAAAGTPQSVFPIDPDSLLDYSNGQRAVIT